MWANRFYISLFIAGLCPGFFSFPVSAQNVFINEVLTSPPAGSYSTTNANSLYNTGSNDLPPFNQEWIELYNPSPCDSVDISCYTLGSNMEPPAGSNYTNWGAFTFPAGTKIPPLGFFIIGGNDSQVPHLDIDINYYRQNFFGTQYLDGCLERWFLRDEYGWIALYNPSGGPVDAVYWDAYNNPGSLYSEEEYLHPIVTTTSCSGTQILASAATIAGIEYAGSPAPGSYMSFQRTVDGGSQWFSSPVTATPGSCNGVCAGPPTLSLTGTDESCAGNDGSITLTITPGSTGPYTINWMVPGGNHNNPLTGLDSGTYIVEVVDSYNCFKVYDTISIGREPQPGISISQKNDETCSSSNGYAQTTVANGNPPYNYVWNSVPPQYSSNILNVAAGNYSVTLTDHLGCTATASVSLINIPGPTIIVDSVINEMCSSANGAIFTTTAGGTSPLSWSWNSTPVQTGADLINVHAGTYTVTVTDSNNCHASTSESITNTPPPTIGILEVIDEKCFKHDGSISITATGGSPPYTYSWSIGAALNTTTVNNLSAGTYTVSVEDANCTSQLDIVLENIPGPKADFTVYPEVRTIENPEFRFTDNSLGNITLWHWEFGDYAEASSQNTTHTYQDTGSYHVILHIVDNEGCRDSVIKEALVIDYITVWAPNCFTPNGDNINDYFGIWGQNITNFKLYIYDRWGELVFESHELTHRWDGTINGKPAYDGVYTWIAFYSEDYRKYAAYDKVIKGQVTLLH
ncbi:MAG: gliding motility-associated C-terminal domain-containing protein [Bacteroidota bacterium]